MRYKKVLIILIFSLIGFFLFINTSYNCIYRDRLSIGKYTGKEDDERHAIQVESINETTSYHLGFIEFDDRGQTKDRNQLNFLLDTLEEMTGDQNTLILTFIHGWHNNASKESSNVMSFRKLLRNLAHHEMERCAGNTCQPYKIFGVYIGWEGESIRIPLLKEFTFWKRKQVAHQVGSQGVTEVLLKLEQLVNTNRADDSEYHTKIVAIGHSFGGAVLYGSLQQVLTDRFISMQQANPPLPEPQNTNQSALFGELVVLINPAFEAIRFSNLYDLSQHDCCDYERVLPNLIILTSESDLATRYLFPLGRKVSTIINRYPELRRHTCTGNGRVERIIKTADADATAIGHYSPYWTHRLHMATEPVHKGLKMDDWLNQKYQNTLDLGFSRLEHLGYTSPRNPFLNIYVDRSLIDGHNDIWDMPLINFLMCMISLKITPSENNHEDKKPDSQHYPDSKPVHDKNR